jgi:hypothetical protein
VNQKEHVNRDQTGGRPDFCSEEIRGPEHVLVEADELRPSGVALAFWDRSQPVLTQNIPDSLIRNLVAQIGQGANDAIIAPAGVVLGKLQDELFHRCLHGTATDSLGAQT